jgi:hypothetical protein
VECLRWKALWLGAKGGQSVYRAVGEQVATALLEQAALAQEKGGLAGLDFSGETLVEKLKDAYRIPPEDLKALAKSAWESKFK